MPAQRLARVALRALALERAGGALTAAGIRWAALKGTDLAHRAYRSPTARDMTDIDLLVDPRQYASAARAVIAAGLQEEPSEAAHHGRFRWILGTSSPGVMIEIHRDLFDAPHGLRLDPAALLDRATTVPRTEGAPLPVLAAEDAWVHIAAHFAYSDVGSVAIRRTFADLVALATACSLDPEEAWKVAHDWGVARPIGVVLQALPGGVLPEDPVLARFTGKDARRGIRAAIAIAALRPRLAQALAREDAAEAERGMEVAPVRGLPASVARALLAPSLWTSARILATGLRRRRTRRALVRPPHAAAEAAPR